MIKQETTQEVYNRQKCVGNSSVSKKEISFLLDQLDKRSVHLIKKKGYAGTTENKDRQRSETNGK